jgi:transcriptional regulator with XRE-family HTH domain
LKNTSIGERIKELRLKKGLTQKAFGEFINISYGHISNIEKGKDIPSDRILELICYKFNVSEDWLKLGEGSLDDRPLYTKVSKLTLDEKKALQNIFNINDFNDDHLYLTKIIISKIYKRIVEYTI